MKSPLRPLTPDEAEIVAEACAKIDPWKTLGYSADGLAGYLLREDAALNRFAIDTEDGALAGVVALRFPWLRGPFIEMLAIMPQMQGKGLGTQVVEWVASGSVGNLWATVAAFNQRARAFYARQGFVEVGSMDELISPGQTELLLRKRLD